MARTWTDEQKARQRELIRRWQPWKASTGPRTATGKAASSQNVKVGQERKAREFAQAKRELMAAMTKVSELSGKRGSLLDFLEIRIG
jgi:hypothetical protein